MPSDSVRRALAITPASTARERTIDITTTGRRSGRPHRIEIWFFREGDRIYLSSSPGRKNWYANLLADPAFTFHLEHGVRADLAARGTPVTDDRERRRVFKSFVDDLNQPSNPARLPQPQLVEDWLAGSPLVAVDFDDDDIGTPPRDG